MVNMIQYTADNIASYIYLIRGEKVMIDLDLALLYGVEVRRLKEAVRRNIKRFPQDFLFELSRDEHQSLRSQFATLKRGQHSKYSPFAFTEQGVAMLSGILNSDRAIQVNIAIMRAFVQVRSFLESDKALSRKIEELEKAVSGHDENIKLIFIAIKELMEEKEKPAARTPVGFKIQGKL
jgi:hypothetical protein